MDISQLKRKSNVALTQLSEEISDLRVSESILKIDFTKFNFYKDEKKIITNTLKDQLEIHGNSIIYCITILDKSKAAIVSKNFKTAKKTKRNGRSYSKDNMLDPDLSNCLYVGSSKSKSFVKRLREHLGYGSISTYALHMNQWLPEDIKIKIEYFSLDDCKSESGYSSLEFLEQALWMQERPMFGKRSGLL